MAKKSVKKTESEKEQSISTRSVHAGEPRRKYADSITTPIIQTSTFTFADSKHIEDYTKKGMEHFEYGRYGNPTAKIAEHRLADLENAEDCVVFTSGMSCNYYDYPYPRPFGRPYCYNR